MSSEDALKPPNLTQNIQTIRDAIVILNPIEDITQLERVHSHYRFIRGRWL